MQLYPDNVHPRIFTVSGGEGVQQNRLHRLQAAPVRMPSAAGSNGPLAKRQFQVALGLAGAAGAAIAQTLADR